VAAGLFLQRFARLQTVDPGFDPRGVMTAAYSLPPGYANPEKQAAFAWSVLVHLQGTKSVIAASIGRPIPFSYDLEGAAFRIEGRSLPVDEATPKGMRLLGDSGLSAHVGNPAGAGPFLRRRGSRGHGAGRRDRREAGAPVLANGRSDGQAHSAVVGGRWHKIVGILRHVMHSDLASDPGRGFYYVSLYQRPMPMGSILVKTSGDMRAAAAAIGDAVRAADPNLPLYT
jgi:putative ABC transport system permease protein